MLSPCPLPSFRGRTPRAKEHDARQLSDAFPGLRAQAAPPTCALVDTGEITDPETSGDTCRTIRRAVTSCSGKLIDYRGWSCSRNRLRQGNLTPLCNSHINGLREGAPKNLLVF